MTSLSRWMLTGVCVAAASASFCASQEKDSRQGKEPAASGPFGSVLLPTSATCAAFSPDGKSIALGSGADGTVTIWDCAGKILHKLPLQKTGVVSHVAFSANGKLLESRIHDSVDDQVVITIRLWDLDAKKVTFQREVSFDAGRSARFSADFQKLALPEGDNAVTIWDAVKDKKVRTHDWSSRDVVDFWFDGKGSLLVMTHSRNKKDEWEAHVWDATAGKKIREVPCIGNPITAPGGKYFTGVIALGPCVGGFVVLGNAETGDAVPLIYLDEQDFGQPTFAPDGKLLMVPLGTAAKAPTGVMYAQVWDAKNARHLFSVGMPGEVYSACMSSSNDKIALVGAKQTLVQPLKIFKHFGGAATITCMSPDGRLMAMDAGKGKLCIADRASGKVVRQLDGDCGPVQALSFSLDGGRVAAGTSEPMARVWDTKTGMLQHSFKVGRIDRYKPTDLPKERQELADKVFMPSVHAVIFSKDGNMIMASSTAGSSSWDLKTGKAVKDD